MLTNEMLQERTNQIPPSGFDPKGPPPSAKTANRGRGQFFVITTDRVPEPLRKGDMITVEPVDVAHHGDIVVVEVTGQRIFLRCTEDRYDTEHCRLIGKVVSYSRGL